MAAVSRYRSMFASPMLMSNDLRTVTPWAKAILLNKHAIAISQDPLGVQAVKILDNTTMGNMTVTQCTVRQLSFVCSGLCGPWRDV